MPPLTPQLKLALLGIAGFAISKFVFNKTGAESLTYGLGAITLVALLTAHNDHVDQTNGVV